MAFQVSPGVSVSEIDLTTAVPGVSTTVGAFAGVFRWGPVGERVLIDSENKLVNTFGRPTAFNPETFFTAANFLGYGNALFVSRAANTTSSNAVIASVSVSGNTSGYVNGNLIILSPGAVGSNASVSFVTNSSGAIQTLTIVNAGQGFNPEQIVPSANIVIANSTGGSTVTGNTAVGFLVARASASIVGAFNAVANTGALNFASVAVKNGDDYESKVSFNANASYIAKYPGALGNSLRISVCDSRNAFESTIDLIGEQESNTITGSFSIEVGSNTGTLSFVSSNDLAMANTYANTVVNQLSVGDLIKIGNTTLGTQYLRISNVGPLVTGNSTVNAVITAAVSFADTNKLAADFLISNTVNGTANVANITRNWEYFNLVDAAPGTSDWVATYGNTVAVDQVHVVVVDQDGQFNGVAGGILEVFPAMSRATDAKSAEGASLYYKQVINEGSRYIWWANDRSNALSNTAANITSSTNAKPLTLDFVGGQNGGDESSVPLTALSAAYDLFKLKETADVSLIMAGKPRGGTSNTQLGNYIIDNIAELRKDCVVFISPDDSIARTNPGNEAVSLAAWKSNVRDSTYAFLDSGYKYMYDRYNDVYRYVPLNGDIAGLAARSDAATDPWYSPAGFNRGQIRNIVKLRFNPTQADRDVLYKSSINPVVSFPGQGTVLYGDKTATSKPSAFDRINVRRLFITLEKAISEAAKFSLFEFNDEFTRSQFRNLVTPFLRDVQSRRGITEFLVVCDSTNNTAERIDRNEFWGDIYVKPNRSINFIQLNFVAVRTGVEFSTVVGRF